MGSATPISTCAWRSRSGTGRTRSSRSGSSASRATRATTARTPRSTGGTSTPRRRTPGCAGATSIPRRAFPYEDLVEENARRGFGDPEYELLDTDALADDRYWDIEVDYAKAGPEDLCLRVRIRNAGPDAAELHLLPTLWFRNRWSWGDGRDAPVIREDARRARGARRRRDDDAHGRRGARGAVLQQRDEHAAPLGPARPALSEGRHQRPRRDRRADRRSRPHRDEGGPVVPAARRRRGDGRGAAAAELVEPRRGQGLGVDAARPGRRGRRVLRRAGSGRDAGGARRHAAGVRRDALEQAVLPLRRRPLAARGSRSACAAGRAPGGPQRGVAPRRQPRRDLDAGQVGVPLVRGVGPGLPLHHARARRPRVRQGAAAARDARVVHAPQRPAAGVRVELR